MSVIRVIEAAGLKTDVPEFRSGDHVKVHVRVVEGDKSRIQVFAVEPQPQPICSMASAALIGSTPAPPYSSGTCKPSKPSGPIFLTASALNSAASSVWRARGLSSFSAKSRTMSRNICCSSVS